MKHPIILAALLLTIRIASAETELKGSPEELRQFLHPVEHTVTLTGFHEENAFSDKAIVSLVITTEGQRLGASMASNTRLRTAIAQSLVDAGVDAGEINTSKFSSSPQFGWFGGKPKSFEVVNRMSVGITDEAHLQLIARLTDENDEIVMEDMAFEHTGEETFQENVRKTALDKALQQRQTYEQQLSVRLVPIGIQEQVVVPRRDRINAREARMAAQQTARLESSSDSFSKAAQPPPQTFDEVNYQATIYVTFKVEQQLP